VSTSSARQALGVPWTAESSKVLGPRVSETRRAAPRLPIPISAASSDIAADTAYARRIQAADEPWRRRWRWRAWWWSTTWRSGTTSAPWRGARRRSAWRKLSSSAAATSAPSEATAPPHTSASGISHRSPSPARTSR
jgi:hypothetical protein